MSNPFDQFDPVNNSATVAANPFDQFDLPALRKPADLSDSIASGAKSMQASEMLDLNRSMRAALPDFERKAKEATHPVSQWWNELNAKHARQSVAGTEQWLKNYQQQAATEPVNPTVERMNQAKTFQEVGAAVWDNPRDAIVHGVASSLIPSATMLGNAYLGGRVAGLPGAIGAGGLESYELERKSGVMEGLQEKGVNIADPQALTTALADKTLMDKVDVQAQQKAAVIGTLDGLSMGIAGKALSSKPLRNAAGQAAIQMGLGSGGEAGGAVFSGQDIKPGAVVLEALAELPGSVVETAIAKRSQLGNEAGTEGNPNPFDQFDPLAADGQNVAAAQPMGLNDLGMPPADAGWHDTGETLPSGLGNLVASGEGGYGSFNQGKAGDAGGAQIDFSQMTVGELLARQKLKRGDENRIFAFGKYQIIPGTMRQAVKALGLDPDTRVTPELQERIFSEFLMTTKRPDLEKYIRGEHNDLAAAQLAGAQEWASIADPRTGLSYHGAKGNNKASISADAFASGLQVARQVYADEVAKGTDAASAWQAALGVVTGKKGLGTAPKPEVANSIGDLANANNDVLAARPKNEAPGLGQNTETNGSGINEATVATQSTTDLYGAEAGRYLSDNGGTVQPTIGRGGADSPNPEDSVNADRLPLAEIGSTTEAAQAAEPGQRVDSPAVQRMSGGGQSEVFPGGSAQSVESGIPEVAGAGELPGEPGGVSGAGNVAGTVAAGSLSDNGSAVQPGVSNSGNTDFSAQARAIDELANEAATSPLNERPEPTPAQKEAGNYKKGKVNLHGLKFAIENPKGSQRKGVAPDGKAWATTMQAHYGDVIGSLGADGDPVDVFLSDRAADPALPVYVIDQVDPESGKFDEHKVMVGYESPESAKAGYLANYADGWQGLGDMVPMSIPEFKEWMDKGGSKREAAKAAKPVRAGDTLTQKAQFADNKIFTANAVEAARARLKKKLGNLNSGFDPEILADGITLAGAYVESGIRSFADYSKAMIGDLGDGVKPYLLSFYEGVRHYPGLDTVGMDSAADAAAAHDALLRPAQKEFEQQLIQDTGDISDDSNSQTTAAPGRGETTQGMGGSNPGGVRPVSGRGGERRTATQPRDARTDTVRVAAGKPADVAEPVERGQRVPDDAGVGSAGADVAGHGRADESRTASDGRTRAGGEKQSDAGAGGRGRRKPTVKQSAEVSPANTGPGNYHITDPKALVGGGAVARFDKNIAAIRLFNQLREEGRKATRAEQDQLAAYTGWGSFGQELFQGSWANPKPKESWVERDQQLREHLGEAEWKSMQRSITTAFYTEPPIIESMWKMLEKAGFKGGRVFEPGIGVGNFFGMMPQALARRSQLAGIELDPVTGGIAQQLYPDANIKVMGYQDSKTPDGFYDLVIGNVPFENTPIADRKYNRLNPMVHDYFFLKGLDQLRPGGVMMAITSTGTLDKKSAKIRRELARKAELVAAIRLPGGAFKEYAGTEVVTDILILKKRAEPITNVEQEGWINSVEVEVGSSGQKVFLNQYFKDYQAHRDIIGKLGLRSGRFGAEVYIEPPADTIAALDAALKQFPGDWFKGDEKPERLSYIANHTDDREGALTLTDKGFHVVRGEYLAPANTEVKYQVKNKKDTDSREDQFRRLIEMRKAYGELIDAERSGLADTETKRAALRGLYDAFRAEHKTLSGSFGLQYLRRIDDPFYPALAALESGEKPAQILRESTMRGKPAIDNPSVEDAFVLARNNAIQPTLAEVAELAGMTPEQVKAKLLASGAVFETVDGDIVPQDMYLSGNVREKYRQALAAVDEGQTQLQRNVNALKAVLPKDIPYFNIEAQLGAPWVPLAVYQEYIAHMLGRGSVESIAVSYKAGRWKARMPVDFNYLPEASTGFGTPQVEFSRLLNAALSNQTINIKRRDSDGNEYVDENASKEVNGKIAEMRQKFGEWLWADPERRVAVEAEYNETRNAYADPVFDGSFLKFEGMALSLGNGPFDLRQHQRNAIWRALVKRKSINAHEVGTGKTFTIGGIAVESRRYGLAKKPLILAHNANSKSVAAEIRMMYPAAKVLYIDNLTPATIDVKLRQIANDDWDAVVLPHSLIDRLALKKETMMGMAQAQIDELEAEAIEQAREDGVQWDDAMLDDPDELKKLRSSTAKDLVKMRNRIIESINKQGQRASKEGAVSFEELGIDMVLVDEVHIFKKPPMVTRMRMKGLNVEASSRSIALKFLADYVRNNNNGGNIHTFTGTPVTNTLTEVFHQMRYIMDEEMKDAGVDQWDGWFGSFAKEVEDVELNAAAEYESVVRLAGFINVPELRRMVGQYMDTVFADDMPEMQPRRTKSGKRLSDKLSAAEQAELLNGRSEQAKDRPYKKVIVDTADLTDQQQAAFREIQSYANAWRKMDKKKKRETMLNGEPESPIIYEGLAAKASFDVRLSDPELAGKEGAVEDDPSSKASRVVRNVLEVYRSHDKAAQVIFTQMGLGTTASRKGERVKVFSTALDIIERLVQGGIPREQIAMIDGSTSKDKRKETADAMNNAEIRVVIGSTESLGVGVNMQRNLRAMHHMDAPWMPGDLEQRNGRGHRQGNQWNTVLEYRYITDRIDGRRWQVLAVKQRFINAFLKAKDDVRVIEGDAASDQESDILSTFAEAAGDPRILIREKMKRKIEQLKDKERLHGHGIADAKRQARRLRDEADRLQGKLSRLEKEGTISAVAALAEQMTGAGFSMTVGKQTFDKRPAATDALKNWAAENVRLGDKPKKVGSLGGEGLYMGWSAYSDQAFLAMKFGSETFESNGLSIMSLENRLRKYGDETDALQATTIETLESAQRAEQVAKEPFRRGDELERAAKDFQELEQDIINNPVPPPAWLRSGAPVDTGVMWQGQEYTVSGHRWNEKGWFVLAADDKGGVVIPYNEVTDEQGMALYETREFVKPEVIERDNPDDKKLSQQAKGRTSSGLSASGLRDELTAKFGAGKLKTLERLGKLRFAALGGALQGRFEDGVVTLDPANIHPGEAWGVFLHEAGEHAGLEAMVGKDKYAGITAHFDRLLKDGNADAIRAVERVPGDTPAQHVASERLAYLVEGFTNTALKTGAAKLLVNRVLAAVRAWAFATLPGWTTRRMQLSVADIQALAVRAARALARDDSAVRGGGDAVRFSQRSEGNQNRNTDDPVKQDDVWAEADSLIAERQPIYTKIWDAIRQWSRETAANGGLGLLTLRQLGNVSAEMLPSVNRYIDRVDQMITQRNRRMEAAGKLAKRWGLLDRIANNRLSWLMHESTKVGIDVSTTEFQPSEVIIMGGMGMVETGDVAREAGRIYEPARVVASKENMQKLNERVKRGEAAFKGALATAGLDKRVLTRWKAEARAMRNAMLKDKQRSAQYPALRRKFLALPEAAQQVYVDARDQYLRMLAETEAAMMVQVGKDLAQATSQQRRSAMAEIRLVFETARVDGVYFPLGRSGDYFVRFERSNGKAATIYRPSNSGQRVHAAVGDNAPRWATAEAALRSAGSRKDLIGLQLAAVAEDDGFVLQQKTTDTVFERFDSALEAEERKKGLEAEGLVGVRAGRLSETRAEEMAGVGQFAAGSLKILEQAGVSIEARDAVYQHYLTFLPSLSTRKQFIHRKKTAGYLNDALNVFARNMQHQAHQISKLEAGSELRELLEGVGTEARDLEGGVHPQTGEVVDGVLAGNIREELKLRHEWVMNPTNASWTGVTSALGFTWYLGASPAAALVNLTQTAVVAYPALGAQYGFDKAAVALKDAAALFDGKGVLAETRKLFARNDSPDLHLVLKHAELSSDEQKAFMDWQDMGVHDVTNAHMLAGIGDTDSLTSTIGFQNTMGKVAHFFQAAEMLNREVTLLAAYRLARAAGGGHEAAVRASAAVTWDTHFDYGNHNRPRIAQNNISKVLLMFKSYGQHMMFNLVRGAYLAGKGDPEARRRIMGTLAVTAALGGLSALPLGMLAGGPIAYGFARAKWGQSAANIGAVSVLAAWMMVAALEDEDEPEDWGAEFRSALRSVGGDRFETLVMDGAVNAALGINLSGRISLNGLLVRPSDRELEGKDLAQYWIEQAAGPVVGVAAKQALAAQLLADGQGWRAIEASVPKFISDPLKGLRYGAEGALTRKGAPVLESDLTAIFGDDLNLWNAFWQAQGFGPAQLGRQYRENTDIKNQETRLIDRKTLLNQAVFVAWMNKDVAGMAAAKRKVLAFGRKHPALEIDAQAVERSLQARIRAYNQKRNGLTVGKRYLDEIVGE